MSRFVVFVLVASSSLVALVAAQQKNVAPILSDARYLSNNGQFGSAYTQGDGVQFKEESDAEGNRRGSYSYVDPSGQRRTVSYTAGKDGFKATGDHLPVAPTPSPVSVPAAAPKSQWQDQWSQPPAAQNQWNQWNSAPSTPKYDDGQWNQWSSESSEDGQWNSESSNDGQWNNQNNQWNSAPTTVAPKYNQWNQWNSAPSTVSPKQNQWNQWNSIPTTAKWNQWNSAPTTPPSYNVNQAPGKISLNRSPDGFSYTFSQN